MDKRLIYFLRWIGVLPVAIASFFISYAFCGLASMFGSVFFETSTSLVHFMSGMISTFCFVELGVLCAPTNKKIVSIVLFIAAIVASIVASTFAFNLGHYSNLVEYGGYLVGSIIAFFEKKLNYN